MMVARSSVANGWYPRKFSPYVPRGPTSPWCRVWNSGDPPMTISPATGLRSAIVRRPYRSAVFRVTVTVSLSSASVDFRSSSCGGSVRVGTAPTCAAVVAVVEGSSAAASAPVYSGMTSICPDLTRG